MPKTVSYNSFYDYLMSDQNASQNTDRLVLNFSENYLSALEINNFRDLILKRTLPPAITVYFLKNYLAARSAKILAEVLQKCLKQTFEFNLANNFVGALGAKYFAESLEYAKDGFKLSLYHNNICDEGAVYFSHALGNAPYNFELNLAKNKITSLGVSSLASAFPVASTGFKLDLSENDLLDQGADLIAADIGNLPDYSSLNISQCKISKAGLLAISNAICSLPNHFSLDISGNILKEGEGDDVVITIIEQLSNPEAPEHLTLNLGNLGITDVGGHLLLDMINSDLTSEGLRLLLNNNEMSDKLVTQIEDTLHQKDIMRALWRCYAFNFGTLDQENPISMLPKEMLNKIYQYVFPTKDKNERFTYTQQIFNFFKPDKRKASTQEVENNAHLDKKARLEETEEYDNPKWGCRII